MQREARDLLHGKGQITSSVYNCTLVMCTPHTVMSLPEHSGQGWNFWRPQCSNWLVASISLSRSRILWTVGLLAAEVAGSVFSEAFWLFSCRSEMASVPSSGEESSELFSAACLCSSTQWWCPSSATFPSVLVRFSLVSSGSVPSKGLC